MPGIVQQVGSNPFCIPLIIYIYIYMEYIRVLLYIYIYTGQKPLTIWDAHPNIQHSTCFIFLFSNLWQVLSDLPSGQTLTMRLLDTGAISLPLPPSLSLSLSPAKHLRLEEEMVYLLYPMISSSFIQRFPNDSPMFNVRIRCFVPFSETTQQTHAQSTYLSCLLLGVDIGFSFIQTHHSMDWFKGTFTSETLCLGEFGKKRWWPVFFSIFLTHQSIEPPKSPWFHRITDDQQGSDTGSSSAPKTDDRSRRFDDLIVTTFIMIWWVYKLE